jgi:hypothetical protein
LRGEFPYPIVGRPSKLTSKQIDEARRLIADDGVNVEATTRHGVPLTTLRRATLS